MGGVEFDTLVACSITFTLPKTVSVNIHASVAVDGRDRQRLERVVTRIACRYIVRPPLSLERLEAHPDGHLRLRFKSAWKDGASNPSEVLFVSVPHAAWDKSGLKDAGAVALAEAFPTTMRELRRDVGSDEAFEDSMIPASPMPDLSGLKSATSWCVRSAFPMGARR